MDNSSFIDVYLEGNAAGWIAVGFSLNLQMVRQNIALLHIALSFSLS